MALFDDDAIELTIKLAKLIATFGTDEAKLRAFCAENNVSQGDLVTLSQAPFYKAQLAAFSRGLGDNPIQRGKALDFFDTSLNVLHELLVDPMVAAKDKVEISKHLSKVSGLDGGVAKAATNVPIDKFAHLPLVNIVKADNSGACRYVIM